jgi:hypothetical protein
MLLAPPPPRASTLKVFFGNVSLRISLGEKDSLNNTKINDELLTPPAREGEKRAPSLNGSPRRNYQQLYRVRNIGEYVCSLLPPPCWHQGNKKAHDDDARQERTHNTEHTESIVHTDTDITDSFWSPTTSLP